MPFAGWHMPVQYRGIVAEHEAVRRRAGLFDVSHMGRLDVVGPQALSAVDRLITNALQPLAEGRALYTCCCREDGGILDDLIVYRRSAEHIFVVCNASNRAKIVGQFQAELGAGATLSDRSPETGLLALQGPKAFEILGALGASWAEALPRFGFGDGPLAGKAVTIARTGYTAEDGVEIVCAAADLVELWLALLETGKTSGLEPIGLGARDTLRLEGRLSLYGNEIDETTHPLEAGLAWTVKLDKGPFIGREALLSRRAAGLSRTLVGLEVLGRGIARHGYRVLDSAGNSLGSVTSGGPAPTLNKNIALAYVPVGHATVGTKLTIDCRGKAVEALVVLTPFYKRPIAR